jgi:magnesium-protoporphyrin O-methyltransferase
MSSLSYLERRGELEVYFDRTAADAWARLTSNAPLGRIRATVRAGRNEMRRTLLDYLPRELSGARVLDAGCGTGALSLEAAERGATVLATDLSPTLIALANERTRAHISPGSVEFRVGDMLDPALGEFDHIVAMDSLIHYGAHDVMEVLAGLAPRTRRSLLFTFAPKTFLLMAMWTAGRLFPRQNRAPALEPIAEAVLRRCVSRDPRLAGFSVGRIRLIDRGFYKSQAMELVRR